MQYLFSQWKGKQWKEKMKIFRKETNQIRWNASRNASLGRKGQDWQASLHMWQHVSHITACPLPKMLPTPPTPIIVKHNFRGNPQLTETDKDPIKLGLQFKGFLLVCKMTILWLFLFPAHEQITWLSYTDYEADHTLLTEVIMQWSCGYHALLTWLIMKWSGSYSVLVTRLIMHWSRGNHALITWLIIHWSRAWSCTDHVTNHELITWLIMHRSRD